MVSLEQATAIEAKVRETSRPDFLKIFIGMSLIGLAIWFATELTDSYLLIVAVAFGAYMAMNIGANDVANNVGPSVGSKVLTMGAAIAIAAVFEASGALIAGGDVVETIRKGIIDPSMIGDTNVFIWLMMAALLGGALWLNIATAVGAPVSTTHSIVGGVIGAGIAAAGSFDIVNWVKMGQIASSWVISPLIGGAIAAVFLIVIKKTIMYRPDMALAAKRMVPILVAIMAWAFGTYLMLKGVKKLVKVDFITAVGIGTAFAFAAYVLMLQAMKRARNLHSDKLSVNTLFKWPLIIAVAFLSFAHGSNDVANAIGPLAAINDAITHAGVMVGSKAAIPLWVMMIGAIGIAAGLALYGPKLIRTVGSEITELDQTRAFCIAMSAAITVIIASQLKLPVSTTHIAVGAVFGIGFTREFLKARYQRIILEIEHHHQGKDQAEVEAFLEEFHAAPVDQKEEMMAQLKTHEASVELTKRERRQLNKVVKEQLVKRNAFYKIVAAWVITVPVSGLIAGLLYFTIRGFMLP